MVQKSCTTWDVYNPVNNGIFTISTGAGFPPSNIGISDFHKFRTTAAFFSWGMDGRVMMF